MSNRIPGYLILILSMFRKSSGSIEDYNNARRFLPLNLSESKIEMAKVVIAEYIGISGD